MPQDYDNSTIDQAVNLPWLKPFLDSPAQTHHLSGIHHFHAILFLTSIIVSSWPTKHNVSFSQKERLEIGIAKSEGYWTYKGLPWTLVLTMKESIASRDLINLQVCSLL